MASDFKSARRIALSLPGTEESTSYGTPAFRVRGKLFARLHQDGESLVVRMELDERDVLVKSDPSCFFVTDHYRAEPWVLVRLRAAKKHQLVEVIQHAWRLRAPKRLVASFDGG